MTSPLPPPQDFGLKKLGPNFFRHAYAQLVALLSHRFGMGHLEIIEDAAQTALMTALEHWKIAGPPDNPTAWLIRVAHNHVLQVLRSQQRHGKILQQASDEPQLQSESSFTPDVRYETEIQDALLRMLFICCDDAISRPSRWVVALKILCGFGVTEIASLLFTTPENVYKRLARAKKKLQTNSPDLDLSQPQLQNRVSSVLEVIYALFTEGYLSSLSGHSIRPELCLEAIRLGELMAAHPVGQQPECFALVALMHLHSARFASRVGKVGELLLLEEQDLLRRAGRRNEAQRLAESALELAPTPAIQTMVRKRLSELLQDVDEIP